MKIRIVHIDKYRTVAAVVLRESKTHSDCLCIMGWNKRELKLSHRRIRNDKLLQVYAPQNNTAMYKIDALSMGRNGQIYPMMYWKSAYPKGWDLKCYSGWYIGRSIDGSDPIKFAVGAGFTQPNKVYCFNRTKSGWTLVGEQGQLPVTKWDKLRPAPTEGWIRDVGPEFGSFVEDTTLLADILKIIQDLFASIKQDDKEE